MIDGFRLSYSAMSGLWLKRKVERNVEEKENIEKHCLADPRELPEGPDKGQKNRISLWEQRFPMGVGFWEGFLEEVTLTQLCNR